MGAPRRADHCPADAGTDGGMHRAGTRRRRARFSAACRRAPPTAEPMPLSVKDAVDRGAPVQSRAAPPGTGGQAAHGARWRALADLLPERLRQRHGDAAR